jgi:hypothetical protein
MLPFALYLAAGVVTAAHLYLLLSLTIVGAPHNALELVSLLGSLGLCISSYSSLFRPQVGAKLALPSALACWSFYGPAILATVSAGRQREIADPRIAALPYIAVLLLASTTVYSAFVSFRKTEEAESGNWIFPARTACGTRTIVAALSLTVAVAGAAWFGFNHSTSVHRASRFLVPAGYIGWVRVEFQVPGSPPLPLENGRYRFEIPRSGLLKTSSSEQFGSGDDEYWYASGIELRPLPATGAVGRMVWGRMNGQGGTPTAARTYEQFFVGTEEQFKQRAGESRVGSVSSTAVAK